jgi:ComF family protein
MTGGLLERLGNATLDALFPPRCGVCGTWGTFICQRCESQLEPAREPRCSRCWRLLSPGSTCGAAHNEALLSVRSAFVYGPIARELVHALKYRGLTALARPMAQLMAGRMAEQLENVDLIVPVPLTAHRRRIRGHNQAEGLSSHLARIFGLEHDPGVLRRRGRSVPQARSASASERYRNVTGAFAVARDTSARHRRVALIDDVTTTGATLVSCAEALRSAGAASVVGLAFAHED